MMPIWLFFADACNDSDNLRQELVRIVGQKNEAEATVASLAVNVTTHRVILLCPFNGSLDEAKHVF